MSAGAYYNGPVADWAKQNIRGRVQVRTLFSSKIGMIVVLALLFCVPLFFIALGVLQLLLGVRDRNSVGGAFACGFVMLFPAALIYVFGMYVRQSFAKSVEAIRHKPRDPYWHDRQHLHRGHRPICRGARLPRDLGEGRDCCLQCGGHARRARDQWADLRSRHHHH